MYKNLAGPRAAPQQFTRFSYSHISLRPFPSYSRLTNKNDNGDFQGHWYRLGYYLLVSKSVSLHFIEQIILTTCFYSRCVGVWQNDRVEIIANDQGNRTTPSYVSFSDTERLIGDAAKNQVAMNPHNTVFDAKRLIGRKFDDAEVQADMKHFPFKVINKGGKPYIEVEYRGETKQFVSISCPS